MSAVHWLAGRFNSVFGWPSSRKRVRRSASQLQPVILLSAIAAIVCLQGSVAAFACPGAVPVQRIPRKQTATSCPTRASINGLLSTASQLMGQEQYRAAADALGTTFLDCDPRVALLAAAAREGSGESAQAQRILIQANARWPADRGLAASLARSYWLAGDATHAAEALRLVSTNAGAPIQELELMAQVYLAVHQLARAQSAAVMAYHRAPEEATLLLLANILQLQGRAQDALRLLEGNRERSAGSVAFLITIAESEYDTGVYAKAHADLIRAIQLDPASYQAHYLLGNTFAKQSLTDEAISEYRKSIALAPSQPRTYYQLALAQVAQNKIEDAQQSLAAALQEDERYAPAYDEIGTLLFRQGKFADAVEPLKKAIQYGPTLESSYFLLTRVYYRLGQKQASDAMLQQYLEVKAANRGRPSIPPAAGDPTLPAPKNAPLGSARADSKE